MQKFHAVSETVTKVYSNGDAGSLFNGGNDAGHAVVLLHHSTTHGFCFTLEKMIESAQHDGVPDSQTISDRNHLRRSARSIHVSMSLADRQSMALCRSVRIQAALTPFA